MFGWKFWICSLYCSQVRVHFCPLGLLSMKRFLQTKPYYATNITKPTSFSTQCATVNSPSKHMRFSASSENNICSKSSHKDNTYQIISQRSAPGTHFFAYLLCLSLHFIFRIVSSHFVGLSQFSVAARTFKSRIHHAFKHNIYYIVVIICKSFEVMKSYIIILSID